MPDAFFMMIDQSAFEETQEVRTKTAILIAEDDPGDAFLIENAFAKHGGDVRLEFVRDGRDVLRYLKREGPFTNGKKHPIPKILLLDLKLPVLDGFEVIERLRREKKFRDLTICVLTASIDPGSMERARELGADCCFIKPASTAEMAELVSELLVYF
jgi:CheY-like chemotaxis protein